MKASTIIVSGPIANKPFNGGVAWIPLSYILGLRRLGFDVYFVEQIARQTCLDIEGNVSAFQDSVNLAYFKDTIKKFGLTNSAALIYDDGAQVFGATYGELLETAADADFLINISGHLQIESLTSRVRRRVYIDEDPGFTQFWHEAHEPHLKLSGHDFYFTMGGNVGDADCSIPTNGIKWRPLRPPVVLDHWPVFDQPGDKRFTTVASWRGPYGAVHSRGKTFGLKVHEFRKFIELPQRINHTFEMALNIHPAEEKDLDLLTRNSWQLVNPRAVAADGNAFREYVQNSGAEFSVAQGIYVETNSGWFSDRTARYLASGKPVLVQDTGFSRKLPVGDGLVAFRTFDEAVAGAESISRDYQTHSRAARAIAKEYFDSDKILSDLVGGLALGV